MRIGLDIDDVLFPWTDHAHAAAEAAGITNGAAVTQWAFFDDYGCTEQEWWDVVNAAYEAGMLLREAYPGVANTLADLRSEGHTVHLATARGFEGPLAGFVRSQTVIWAGGVPHDSLTFTRDKTVIDCDVFLDDSGRNVRALREHGVLACLRDQVHNRSEKGLPRVSDLDHFLDLIGVRDPASRRALEDRRRARC